MALQALFEIDSVNHPPDQVLAYRLGEEKLSEEGAAFAHELVRGVLAAPCHDSITAEMSRRHNNANVLCLSGDLLGADLIDHMIRIWLTTEFEGGRPVAEER